MSVSNKEYTFDEFPPFFDGLLPEGVMLEGLLRKAKLDNYDLFGQLMRVGGDMVGSVTVEEIYE
jgi:serine/threonine-protein kinase HipA